MGCPRRRWLLLLVCAPWACGASVTGPEPVNARNWDWVGVIGTGQSLALGTASGEPISTRQRYGNLRLLDRGPAPRYPLDGRGLLALVPLVEPIREPVAGYLDDQYPNNILGETPHTAMADQLSVLAAARGVGGYVTVHSAVGWGGHCLVDIDRDGPSSTGVAKRAYLGSLSEARSIRRLATASGRTFGYGAVVLTHGECDASNPSYGAGLVALAEDYDRDLRAITRQRTPVVMLASQQSVSGGNPEGNVPWTNSAVELWRASRAHPGRIVCTGPKYQYEYGPDHLHMPAASYRRLGEKYAEVFEQVVDHRVAWQPLAPVGAWRVRDVVTVTFHVPNPPLPWESSVPSPHQHANVEWAAGHGFELADSTGKLTITEAWIEGDAVRLRLASVPRGAGLVVRYAATQDGEFTQGGTALGRYGQLRDSDPLVGVDAELLVCTLARGSTTVACLGDAPLARRAERDLVDGPDLSPGTVMLATDRRQVAILSAPWAGASGLATLRFRHDLRNYCVHFELLVS